jgi:hypothetical protein
MAFSDNVWWTRKSRIQTEKRLLANAFQSQILLLWYSFSGVAASIYYLQFETNSETINLPGISWVVYSVLVLCISGFINGLSFKERAGLIKECYETLNGFYQKAKLANADVDKLVTEYDQILGVCENHKDEDYYLALCTTHVTQSGTVDNKTGLKPGLDRAPTWYHWVSITWWTIKRYAMFTLLYLMPILLFISLEAMS